VDEGNVVVLVAPQGAGEDEGRGFAGNWPEQHPGPGWSERNLPAMQANAINQASRACRCSGPDVDPERISARATGVAGIWLLLAAAVNPRIGKIVLRSHTVQPPRGDRKPRSTVHLATTR